MKKRLIILLILIVSALAIFIAGGIAASADSDNGGEAELNQSISELLKDLDLSELQKYLDENSDSYLFNFGDTAK